jgi:ribosomal subunit interface protein
MNIQITARHSRASESLKETLTNDVLKLERFAEKITSCHVILDSESVAKTVEINLTAHGVPFTAKAKAENLGKAQGMAMEKIERQLKKLSEKIKNHKAPSEKELAETVEPEE